MAVDRGAQQPVEYEVLVSKAQGSVSRAVGELPRAPAVADSPGELVLDFTRPEPDDVPTAGLARVRGWVVAVAREDLPSSPFGLVQVLDGLTRYQVKVDVDDGELPRTGTGPWVRALAVGSASAGVGALAVGWTRRRSLASRPFRAGW